MSEKRKHQRLPLKFKVDWKSEGNFLFENATNISEHGIFIETKEPMATGTLINLQFMLPDSSKKMDVLGKVTWVNPVRKSSDENYNPGMGVRFENLTEVDREIILSLIKRIAVL